MASSKKKILLLTLVHPDFLPPVYATAQTLRDLNYEIHILTFDSFVPSELNLGSGIVLETLGKHHNIPFLQRLKLRRKFSQRTAELVKEGQSAIISFCTFSFLTALKFRKFSQVAYYALEMDDFSLKTFSRSPFSQLKNFRVLRNLAKANFVATPSVQRSAWLAGRSHIDRLPHTILNTSYLSTASPDENSYSIYKKLVPGHFSDKRVVLYTGAVNDRLCVFELVKAFELLNNPNCALVMTGFKDNDYCNKIIKYINSCTNKENIKYHPYVTRTEMLALQQHADIGVCLTREYERDVESKMIAPNKVGEYLMKQLFIVGTKCEYMNLFEYKSVGTLAATNDPKDICISLKKALEMTEHSNFRQKISEFVKTNYCMQEQLKPMIQFLIANDRIN